MAQAIRGGAAASGLLERVFAETRNDPRFMQEISDAWMTYTDTQGSPLNIRPHWAKQWQGLQVRGTPIVPYLSDVAYKDRIPELGVALNAVAAAGGYTLADLQNLFSNRLLDEIFGQIFV